ncbi:hypothetical protein Q9295_08900 [Xinfangfangia sp. CPCC 101601]|uniref:MFS transporter n=1 Tax=Pseudogemmobacter lacusdianii TaxID=3069608 RepID=A0ABU0VZ65_9RHOB|nr:MFS transporter [Xinfangfangia sp. CPCC 101601]MDQ2066490.1 hypothetical protein [Xinfangfangia sp. CPCC 101601]
MRIGLGSPLGVLLTGLASFTMMGFAQGLIGPALPELTRNFSLPEGAAGLLVSAQWGGSAIGVAAIYFWSHRITPRLALAILAVGGAGLTLQPSWVLMLISALVFGTGYGMATAVFNPRVLQAFQTRGASMVGLLNAAYAAGAILSPLAFVALGNSSMLAFGTAAAAYLVIWLFAAEPTREAIVQSPSKARTGFKPHYPLLVFAALGIGLEATLAGLGPTALIRAGASEAQAAQLLSGFFFTFLAARLGLGLVADRIGSFTLYVAAMALTVLASGAAVMGQEGVAFVAMGASAGMFFPAIFVTGARKMGDDPRVTPVILGSALVGGIGMPLLVSWLGAGLGEMGFFWLVLAISAPAALAAALSLRSMAR